MAMTEEEMKAFFEVDQEQPKRNVSRQTEKRPTQSSEPVEYGPAALPHVNPTALQDLAARTKRFDAQQVRRTALMEKLADEIQAQTKSNPIEKTISNVTRSMLGDEGYVDKYRNLQLPMQERQDSIGSSLPGVYDRLKSFGLVPSLGVKDEQVQASLDQIAKEEQQAGQKAYDDYIRGLTGGSQ